MHVAHTSIIQLRPKSFEQGVTEQENIHFADLPSPGSDSSASIQKQALRRAVPGQESKNSFDMPTSGADGAVLKQFEFPAGFDKPTCRL